MHDVFYRDDAVVHHFANGDGQAAQGHGIDADTQCIHYQQAADEGHRHGNEGDERGAPVHQEQEQHRDDDQCAFQQGDIEVVHRRFDEVGLPEYLGIESDASRQLLPDVGQCRLDLVSGSQGVGAVGLGYGTDHGIVEPERTVTAFDIAAEADLGNIVDGDRYAIA